MPIHDWKRADVGLFHHFHQSWAVALAAGLNGGVLPKGYFALVEQRTAKREPDVLALKLGGRSGPPPDPLTGGGVAVATAPPRVRRTASESEAAAYARKANIIGVRDRHGLVVSMIEIVSPGNKHSKAAMAEFLEKTTAFLRSGVSVLVVDLFPPTPRDPFGIHKAIWDEFQDEPFDLPAGEPLVVASYDAGPPRTAYVETAGVGGPVPEMPVFLTAGVYVPAPLDDTYNRTWDACPAEMREMVLNPDTPPADES